MALSSAIVWEIRSTATASNANGGGFKTGASGVDYSQQDAAQYSLTGLTSAGAGATILTASAADDMVGNIIYITAGTNFTAGRYEITAVSAGVSITVDRNCTSGVGADGVAAIGGALSLGSSDDAIFENAVAGHTFYVKNGTYTINGAISVSVAGTITSPIKVIGYNATREDNPTGDTRPTWNAAANAITFPAYWNLSYLHINGTSTGVCTVGAQSIIKYCKIVNKSTNNDRASLTVSDATALFCEVISYRGLAVVQTSGSVIGCYIHDSRYGIYMAGFGIGHYSNNILAANSISDIHFASANTSPNAIMNNTIVGFASGVGVGMQHQASGGSGTAFLNNIIKGKATGVSRSTSDTAGYDDFNNYFGNTADVLNWTKGANDIALDPTFASVGEVTGTTASSSATTWTDSTKDFTALGVVAGRDYLYVVSGTGVTSMAFGITAVGTTTLTLDVSPGTNATEDKVYKIMIGRDFSVGSNMRSVGTPGLFPNGINTGYIDIGAVQSQYGLGIAATGGGGYIKGSLGNSKIG